MKALRNLGKEGNVYVHSENLDTHTYERHIQPSGEFKHQLNSHYYDFQHFVCDYGVYVTCCEAYKKRCALLLYT